MVIDVKMGHGAKSDTNFQALRVFPKKKAPYLKNSFFMLHAMPG